MYICLSAPLPTSHGYLQLAIQTDRQQPQLSEVVSGRGRLAKANGNARIAYVRTYVRKCTASCGRVEDLDQEGAVILLLLLLLVKVMMLPAFRVFAEQNRFYLFCGFRGSIATSEAL